MRDHSFQFHCFAIVVQRPHIDPLDELFYTPNRINAGDGSPAQQGGI
tara:strand:- start:658 stop:798 length:141 start_codon:yes stop_codon:yes gene_type:complete